MSWPVSRQSNKPWPWRVSLLPSSPGRANWCFITCMRTCFYLMQRVTRCYSVFARGVHDMLAGGCDQHRVHGTSFDVKYFTEVAAHQLSVHPHEQVGRAGCGPLGGGFGPRVAARGARIPAARLAGSGCTPQALPGNPSQATLRLPRRRLNARSRAQWPAMVGAAPESVPDP